MIDPPYSKVCVSVLVKMSYMFCSGFNTSQGNHGCNFHLSSTNLKKNRSETYESPVSFLSVWKLDFFCISLISIQTFERCTFLGTLPSPIIPITPEVCSNKYLERWSTWTATPRENWCVFNNTFLKWVQLFLPRKPWRILMDAWAIRLWRD